MIRTIIKIDREKCNGCGACVTACQEGAIQMIDGKAALIRDDYCDGLGNCLPVCPTDAIAFEEREAAAFDEEAVKANMERAASCAGTQAAAFHQAPNKARDSRLSNFPVQLQLVALNAPFLAGADLLLAADCAAYAMGNFHETFMKNRVTLIACPKLDQADYVEKLTAVLKQNDIRSLTLVRMEVPCCSGLERIVKKALEQSGKFIPSQTLILSTKGEIITQ